jgi:RRXRR protein
MGQNNLRVEERQSRMMRKCHVRFVGEGDTATYALLPDLKAESNQGVRPLEIKIDPGSKVTGLAILCGSKLIWAAELTHRGATIQSALLSRRQLRRGRRSRTTRYRLARFLNRTRPKGWLAPSLQHRVGK